MATQPDNQHGSSRTTAAAGRSLHIGLNFVDPGHYNGWDGELNACEYDLRDMAALAKSAGFDTTTLIRQQATRANVLSAFGDAAAALRAGDIFLVTYSGHGGQLPDYSGDEVDAIDETWCLFDGQLIDDELFECWQKFAEGVRIFVISDSCHSGSVFRKARGLKLEPSTVTDTDGQDWGEKPRAMPAAVGAETYRNNRAQYDGLQDELYQRGWKKPGMERTVPVDASVRLFSGCRDDQYSFDGVANGHFTERLLRVWRGGRFDGDYEAFHDAIVSQMRADQTSQHSRLGKADPAYDGQNPFII